MRKNICISLLCLLAALPAGAQGRLSVSILGDSYSTFEGYVQPDTNAVWYWAAPDASRTDVSDVRQTWWHKLVSECGYKLCVNNSFSGATVCYSGYKRGKPDYADYSDRSFITRAANLGDPDIILIFGGTNDAWADSPIGDYQYEGWKREDLFAFRPAMACLLERVLARYPNVRVYFLLNDGLKEEINESVRTVCAHYGVACIELAGIDKQSSHPSAKGMEQIKEQVKARLQAE